MDDVMCDYTRGYRTASRANPELQFPQSALGFFENLKPMDHAIESVYVLRELFDVYVLTAPSPRNPHSYTEKRIWVENHFDYAFAKKLIINPNKGLMKGDFLIDDQIDRHGQELFRGELIHFCSAKYPDWPAVMKYFGSVAKS